MKSEWLEFNGSKIRKSSIDSYYTNYDRILINTKSMCFSQDFESRESFEVEWERINKEMMVFC